MIKFLLAHAGEVHETTVEASRHQSSGITLSTTTMFWIVLIFVPIILWGIMHFLKLALSTKLLVLSTFLIIFSVASYQAPGVYSVISLVIGVATVFILTIVGLSQPE